jgi:hypothetical protein
VVQLHGAGVHHPLQQGAGRPGHGGQLRQHALQVHRQLVFYYSIVEHFLKSRLGQTAQQCTAPFYLMHFFRSGSHYKQAKIEDGNNVHKNMNNRA